MYNDYAFQTGFSVRKGKTRYNSGSKNIKQREFLCSKEGFKLDEDPLEEKKVKRLETRIGSKPLFVSMSKMVFGRLLHLIPSIIMTLHCHQRDTC